MSAWAPAPPPPTKLGLYRQLAHSAGVHVSPLCLGGMSIGDKWANAGFGAMDKDSSFKLLDAFFDAGGNFVDTACNYQDESSEEFLGEWMETRGIREQMVIATKVCSFAGYLGFPSRLYVTHPAGVHSIRPTSSVGGLISSRNRRTSGTV